MKKIFKNLKEFWSSAIVSLLSLIFANGVKSQSMPITKYGAPPIDLPAPLYGIVPVYGITPPAPGQTLLNLLPQIISVFLVFVIAPVAGLIWYRKRGGTKKWPSVIVWTLAIFFVLALATLIILLYTYRY